MEMFRWGESNKHPFSYGNGPRPHALTTEPATSRFFNQARCGDQGAALRS